jgi:hypothetical protein
MRKLSSTNLFPFVGKLVKDAYDRPVGRIASFMITPNGRVDEVLIEHGDGEFIRYSTDQFRVNNDGVVLQPPIKLHARALCNEIPLIWRKDQALSDLLEKKKISSEVFEGLHTSFEGALNQLRTDAKAVLDDIDEHVTERTEQIKDLHSALVNLEIEREIGRVNDESYQTAMQMIQKGLERANAEKNDLESMRSKLSNLLLGEEAPNEAAQPSAPAENEQGTDEESKPSEPSETSKLPEPPVVVRVKSDAAQAS